MSAGDEGDYQTLRIFTLLFVNSFLIGAAVSIHQQELWFPSEDNWFKVGGLYMMAATFVQMISFMLYKIFFQERLEDQTYQQNITSQMKRNIKRMTLEAQKFQMGLELTQQQTMIKKMMEEQRSEAGLSETDEIPMLGLRDMS